jgi:hypothetical protein
MRATIEANEAAKDEIEVMEEPPPEGPTPSVILGRIASLWIDTAAVENATTACQTHPCEAKVEVLAVEQMGSGYHGEFEAGTMLQAHFIFTLSPTENVLPELNTPLPGLKEGDYFRAEVNYREHGPLRIGSYERIEQ